MADTIKRNANYTGDDQATIEWQARSDALIAEFGQARLKDDATLTALDRDLIKELVVLYDNAFDALDKVSFLNTMTADVDYQWRVIYRVVPEELLFQVASINAHDYRRL